MTKAKRVHSTPPLNSSAIQEANPPPEASSESADSFSQPSAIGQPESGNLTSESKKPAKGLSRRAALAGLAILGAAAPAAATVPIFDTATTELVARFERLLDEYYVRQKDWGPRLAKAHAEADELFGEEYDAEGRRGFFSEACARLAVDEASDRMNAVGEEMKPLARAIIAWPTTSLEALRAKALVAFWEVAPLGCDESEYYFDNETQFQLLFSAVAEFCGLTRRIVATGYTLPEMPDLFSPCEYDEGEEA